MYALTYIHTYTYVYIHVYVCMYICIYICADPITSTVVTCMKARCPFYAAVYDTTGKPCREPLIRLYSSSIQALLMHAVRSMLLCRHYRQARQGFD